MTQEQIAKLAELQGVTVEVAEGTLAMFERGEGELPAAIFDAAETAELFASVREAYFAAHGVAEAPLSKIDEPEVAVEEAVVSEEAVVATEIVDPTSGTETAL